MIYLIIAAIAAALFAFCYYQNNKIDITKYNIYDEKINGDVKIAIYPICIQSRLKPCSKSLTSKRRI